MAATMRKSEIDEFAGVALDLLTSAACERRNHNRSQRDVPRNMDRDEAVRWLLRAGADPKFFDGHISMGVRVEMEAGKFGALSSPRTDVAEEDR